MLQIIPDRSGNTEVILPWLESAGQKGSFTGRSGISREEEEEKEEEEGDFKSSINFHNHHER